MTGRLCPGKTLALQMTAAGRLSSAGRDRLRSHLAACPACQAQARGIAHYEALLIAARNLPPPELDLRRLRMALTTAFGADNDRIPIVPMPRSNRQERHGHKRWWLLPLVASVGLSLWVAQHTTDRTKGRSAPSTHNRPAYPAPVQYAQVMALMGEAQLTPPTDHRCVQSPVRWDDDWTGPPLAAEGWTARTGPRSVLDLRLDDGTQLRLGANTEARLRRLRWNEVALTLVRGELFQTVAKRDFDARYRVDFGQHAAQVYGTRFSVQAEGVTTARVEVQEGRVELLQPGRPPRWLTTNQRWTAGTPPEATTALTVSGRAFATTRPGGAGGAGGAGGGEPLLVRLPGWPAARELQIDGRAYPYAQPLQLRLPPHQAVELQVTRLDGRHLRGLWTPRPEATSPTAKDLLARLHPDQAELAPPKGELSEQALKTALSSGYAGFQRCYEQALRRRFEGTPRLRLRVQLAGQGQVERVAVRGRLTDAAFRRCLVTTATRLRFPPPGGPLTFEVPLSFRTRRMSP